MDKIKEVMGLVKDCEHSYHYRMSSKDGAYDDLDEKRWLLEAKLRELLEREPLSDDDLYKAIVGSRKMAHDRAGWVRKQRIEYGRAVERAHGIGNESKEM